MANLDFSKYLNIPVEDVKQPKPIPQGHYFATITKWEGREVEYEKGTKTPVVTLSFRITAADDDVEEDLLPEGGGQGRIITRDYRLNDPDRAGLWALRKLAEDTCKLTIKGLEFEDMPDQLPRQEFKIYNEPRAGKEEGQFFPNVRRVLSVHENADA